MSRFLGYIIKRSHCLRRRSVLVPAIVALFLVIGMLSGPVRAGHTDPDVNAGGFLWAPNFGWISLNCLNDWNGDGAVSRESETRCDGPGGDYGVIFSQAGVAGDLTGYGWSPNFGLMCFGTTCRDTMTMDGSTPDGTALDASFNFDDAARTAVVGREVVAYVTGWARVLSGIHSDDQNAGGWVRLSGIPGPRSPENGGVGVRVVSQCVGGEGADCMGGEIQSQFVIAGGVWQRETDGTGTGIGWIYFGDPPPGNVPGGDEDGSASTIHDVPAGLRRYDTENQTIGGVQGCADGIDNDHDDGINTPDQTPDLNGRDCQDYDCAGLNFYSASYPDSGGLRCGISPPRGSDNRIHENALSSADCFDGIDNDLDAWIPGPAGFYTENRTTAGNLPIDCGDPDCADAQLGDRRCSTAELVENTYNGCNNGTDDDGDRMVDCADSDCNSSTGFVLCPERIPSCLCASHPRAQGYAVPACVQSGPGANDRDLDGVVNSCDNCPDNLNPNQEDTDADGMQGAHLPRITGGDACDPVAWLQTRSGPLYAYKLGGTPPPSGAQGYTATYCISTSGDITPADTARTREFTSATVTCPTSQVAPLRLKQYGQDSVVFSSDNLLRARLDVSGLKAGRYGTVQELGGPNSDGVSLTIEASSLETPSGAIRVYHHRGNLTLTGGATFKNGVGTTQSGARLILVENGDLTITGNLAYEVVGANSGSNLRNLASMGFFVVNGNIRIAPAATSLVGTYITSGTFSSGHASSSLDVALNVGGLLVAQKFEFERTYADLARGAEQVTYDGRAALNPPPGFADFIKTMPTFRSIAPR